MHEEGKLQEASHFLGQMRSSLEDPEVFRYNLSAFLSAGRSVAQYALKEAQTKPGGQVWYDRFVDWEGNEEIPELCERYLAVLKRLVVDGRARGMLSTPEHAA